MGTSVVTEAATAPTGPGAYVAPYAGAFTVTAALPVGTPFELNHEMPSSARSNCSWYEPGREGASTFACNVTLAPGATVCGNDVRSPSNSITVPPCAQCVPSSTHGDPLAGPP